MRKGRVSQRRRECYVERQTSIDSTGRGERLGHDRFQWRINDVFDLDKIRISMNNGVNVDHDNWCKKKVF